MLPHATRPSSLFLPRLYRSTQFLHQKIRLPCRGGNLANRTWPRDFYRSLHGRSFAVDFWQLRLFKSYYKLLKIQGLQRVRR
jgi:hypothetical protein